MNANPPAVALSHYDSKSLLAVVACFGSFLYLQFAACWADGDSLTVQRLHCAVAVLPFVLFVTKGVGLSISAGLLLSMLWMTYTLLLTAPILWPFIGHNCLIMVYMPILGVVFYKKPHDTATPLFLVLETVFWDWPLLAWIHLTGFCGGRALIPFFSPIAELEVEGTTRKRLRIAVGSIPLSADVGAVLCRQQHVELVLNMCKEYPGPMSAYNRYGLRQLRLPTPDLCEPRFEDLLRGCKEIFDWVDDSVTPPREECGDADDPAMTCSTVFIHCKAGRGRAASCAYCVLLALCNRPNCRTYVPGGASLLIADGKSANIDALAPAVRQQRSVIERYVSEFRVVRQFERLLLQDFNGDFRSMYSSLVER